MFWATKSASKTMVFSRGGLDIQVEGKGLNVIAEPRLRMQVAGIYFISVSGTNKPIP